MQAWFPLIVLVDFYYPSYFTSRYLLTSLPHLQESSTLEHLFGKLPNFVHIIHLSKKNTFVNDLDQEFSNLVI